MKDMYPVKHVLDGGTGITNFSPEQAMRYAESLLELGTAEMFIGEPMQSVSGQDLRGLYLCLHSVTAGGFPPSIGAFWRIFDQKGG